jgi:hypothetical protein
MPFGPVGWSWNPEPALDSTLGGVLAHDERRNEATSAGAAHDGEYGVHRFACTFAGS